MRRLLSQLAAIVDAPGSIRDLTAANSDCPTEEIRSRHAAV